MKSKRGQLVKGQIENNGIVAYLDDKSNYEHYCVDDYARRAMMKFDEGQWWSENDGEPYPEIEAIESVTPIEKYCVPPDAEYEMIWMDNGNIGIKIFAKEMSPDVPVLHWIFPNPKDCNHDPIYKKFAVDYGLTPSDVIEIKSKSPFNSLGTAFVKAKRK